MNGVTTMSVSAVHTVSRWSTYAAMTEVRSDRAQLLADIAAEADPQIIAADKLNVTSSTHRLTAQAGRIDVLA
jgi:hypothetical protein